MLYIRPFSLLVYFWDLCLQLWSSRREMHVKLKWDRMKDMANVHLKMWLLGLYILVIDHYLLHCHVQCTEGTLLSWWLILHWILLNSCEGVAKIIIFPLYLLVKFPSGLIESVHQHSLLVAFVEQCNLAFVYMKLAVEIYCSTDCQELSGT